MKHVFYNKAENMVKKTFIKNDLNQYMHRIK